MMCRDSRGFTLIEVMAAMLIFSIAVTAAFATFEFQQKSYTTQSRLSETQKNVREAMELITRDIRLAGYGIPAPVTVPALALPFGLTGIRGIVSCDSSVGSDNIYVLYLYDMDGNQPPTTDNSPFTANSNAGVTVASTAGFVSGDLFLVANDISADLYKVSGSITSTVLPNDSGGLLNYNSGHSNLTTYASGSGTVVAKARFVKYYIDSTDSNHPTLMLDKLNGQTPQPVADDIEDMQFQYTLDDGTPGHDNVIDSSRIRQVHLLLSGRTRQVEKGWSEARPQMFNHPAGAATGHRRRMLDMTIDVRNAGL